MCEKKDQLILNRGTTSFNSPKDLNWNKEVPFPIKEYKQYHLEVLLNSFQLNVHAHSRI